MVFGLLIHPVENQCISKLAVMNHTISIIILIINIIFLIGWTTFLISNKRLLLKIKSFFLKLFGKKTLNFIQMKDFSHQLGGVLIRMSNDVVGCLIVIECKDKLNDYVKLGYPVLSAFSSEFLVNVFYNKSSPLHDGGVIIRDREIIAVSSYFPMTQRNLAVSYGARHRAAVGISEETDAIAFVVSETSGKISYAQKGQINTLDNNLETITKQIYALLTKNNSDYQGEELIISNDLEMG